MCFCKTFISHTQGHMIEKSNNLKVREQENLTIQTGQPKSVLTVVFLESFIIVLIRLIGKFEWCYVAMEII